MPCILFYHGTVVSLNLHPCRHPRSRRCISGTAAVTQTENENCANTPSAHVHYTGLFSVTSWLHGAGVCVSWRQTERDAECVDLVRGVTGQRPDIL